jgi:hypothetical protein
MLVVVRKPYLPQRKRERVATAIFIRVIHEWFYRIVGLAFAA